jgi:tetratricopeptide (TPR) repeat protein
MSELLHSAKNNEQMVMVVVTQPDWCPPCIQLENKIINNPDEEEFSALAKDWLVLEIYGYDKPGADFLKNQNLKFHGTPTVFLLDSKKINTSSKSKLMRDKLKSNTPELKLGDLKVVHSIAGMPDDFTAQFKRAASGFDLVAEAQKEVRAEQTIEAYRKLATAYVDQGKVKQADRVFQTMLFREDLLEEEIQDIKWEQISQVMQRVEKDHAGTVEAIDDFVEMYPDFLEDEDKFTDYAYKRSWSLVAIDRAEEAKSLLRKAFVEANDVGAIRTYLYFAFRNPDPLLLADAKEVCDKALEEFPDEEMGLMAAQGRLMRRLGDLEQAKVSFTRAVELAVDDEAAKEIYLGQLKFVEQQLAKTKT